MPLFSVEYSQQINGLSSIKEHVGLHSDSETTQSFCRKTQMTRIHDLMNYKGFLSQYDPKDETMEQVKLIMENELKMITTNVNGEYQKQLDENMLVTKLVSIDSTNSKSHLYDKMLTYTYKQILTKIKIKETSIIDLIRNLFKNLTKNLDFTDLDNYVNLEEPEKLLIMSIHPNYLKYLAEEEEYQRDEEYIPPKTLQEFGGNKQLFDDYDKQYNKVYNKLTLNKYFYKKSRYILEVFRFHFAAIINIFINQKFNNPTIKKAINENLQQYGLNLDQFIDILKFPMETAIDITNKQVHILNIIAKQNIINLKEKIKKNPDQSIFDYTFNVDPIMKMKIPGYDSDEKKKPFYLKNFSDQKYVVGIDAESFFLQECEHQNGYCHERTFDAKSLEILYQIGIAGPQYEEYQELTAKDLLGCATWEEVEHLLKNKTNFIVINSKISIKRSLEMKHPEKNFLEILDDIKIVLRYIPPIAKIVEKSTNDKNQDILEKINVVFQSKKENAYEIIQEYIFNFIDQNDPELFTSEELFKLINIYLLFPRKKFRTAFNHMSEILYFPMVEDGKFIRVRDNKHSSLENLSLDSIFSIHKKYIEGAVHSYQFLPIEILNKPKSKQEYEQAFSIILEDENYKKHSPILNDLLKDFNPQSFLEQNISVINIESFLEKFRDIPLIKKLKDKYDENLAHREVFVKIIELFKAEKLISVVAIFRHFNRVKEKTMKPGEILTILTLFLLSQEIQNTI